MRILLAAALLGLTGCAELSLFTLSRAPQFLEPDAMHPVTEILCLWEPSDGTNLEGQPTRGFAGQMFFFTRGRAESAKVNGTVTLYLFDDHGTPEEQARPAQQMEFTSDQWNYFLTLPKVGPAYQLFLPYSRPGTYEATCAIRVRYTPADGGPPVFSRMATIALPGRRRPAQTAGAVPSETSRLVTPQDVARFASSNETARFAATANGSRFATQNNMQALLPDMVANVRSQGLEQQLSVLRSKAQAAAYAESGQAAYAAEPRPLSFSHDPQPIGMADSPSMDPRETVSTVGKYRLVPLQ